MKDNKSFIIGFLTCAVLVMGYMMINPVQAEVTYGYDKDLGDFYTFPRHLPSQLINGINSTGLTTAIITEDFPKQTIIYYNMTEIQSNNPELEMTNEKLGVYFNSLNNKLDEMISDMSFFSSIMMPEECGRDTFSLSTIYGEYNIKQLDDKINFTHGILQPYNNPNDTFCLEVLNNG